MRSKVHFPGHITGFFEICEDPDPVMAGSRGCGVVIEKGIETSVLCDYADENVVRCTMDGKEGDLPVSVAVAHEILDLSPEPFEVEIKHTSEIPIGYGFGASAAGALGTAFALNDALDLDLPETVWGRIAHRAEVENKTGLGDVIAELAGGIVIRTEPGSPGVGRTEKIPWDGEVVAFMVGGEMDTSAVLTSDKAGLIKEVGAYCMGKLLEEKTPENFMKLSLEFAQKTHLMTPELKEAVSILEKNGIPASMAMLGGAVFCLCNTTEEVAGVLDHPNITSTLSKGGAG
jgi:pantoate kinase